VALFAVEGNPKTAIELFNFVKQHVASPETSGANVTDADLVLKWLMAAGQVELGRQTTNQQWLSHLSRSWKQPQHSKSGQSKRW
jgi:hypothetical protein